MFARSQRYAALAVLVAWLLGSNEGLSWAAVRASAQTVTPDAPADPVWIGPPGPWRVDRLVASPDGRIIIARRDVPNAAREELVRTVDGGATWERLAFPDGYQDAPNRHAARLRLALAQQSGQWVLLVGAEKGAREEGERHSHQIVRSTDLGTTWTRVADIRTTRFEQPELVLSPSFETDGVALLVTEERLYRTADAGQSWQVVADPTERHIRRAAFSPQFAQDRHVIALLRPRQPYSNELPATPPMALHSTDGGMTWDPFAAEPLPSDVERPVLAGLWFGPGVNGAAAIFALAGAESLRIGSVGRWMRSSDGGASWQTIGEVPIPINWQGMHLAFSPRYAEDGVAVLGSGMGCRMVRTADAGVTWTPIPVTIPDSSDCNDVQHVVHDGDAFLVGFDAHAQASYDSRWLRSSDGGVSWEPYVIEGIHPWTVAPQPTTGGAVLGTTAGVWISGNVAPQVAPQPQIACREPVDGAIRAVWLAEAPARRGLGCPLEPAQPAWIREVRDERQQVTSYWIDGAGREWYQLGSNGRWRTRGKASQPWPDPPDDALAGRVQYFEGGLVVHLPRPDGFDEIVVLTTVDGMGRRYTAPAEATP